jgi:hypothetical protein
MTVTKPANPTDSMDKQPESRAATPRCEISYDFDPKGEFSRRDLPHPS